MFRLTCLVAENVNSLSTKLKAKAGRIFKPLDAHAHACFANLLGLICNIHVWSIYMLWLNFIICLNFILVFGYKLIRIHYHTQKQKKIKFT